MKMRCPMNGNLIVSTTMNSHRTDNCPNRPDGAVIEVKMPAPGKTPSKLILFMKVDELELSVRSANCLKNANIVYVGDLVQRTEAEMLRGPNFGRKSLNEIRDVRSQMGLHFGMEIPGWPPKNVEQLSRLHTKLVKKVNELEALFDRPIACRTSSMSVTWCKRPRPKCCVRQISAASRQRDQGSAAAKWDCILAWKFPAGRRRL